MARPKEPTCAAHLLRPFSRLLRTYDNIPRELIEGLAGSEAAAGRMVVAVLLKLVETAAALTGDPDLGLRAALFTELGDFEVLEWVATSAASWREANQTACRYIRVLNEAADYRLEICGDKAHLILGSAIPLSRVTSDFQIAAYHLAIRLRIPEVPPELEVWMKHEEPADISGYRAIFPQAKLVFRAAFDGFVSDAWRLDTPLPTADQALYRVLRAQAEDLLADSGPGDSLVQRVSADILATLRLGNMAAERTAARLGMSRRTLARRLKQRGTSYTELFKEARYLTAMHYLRNTAHRVEDIAFLLGFSECSPFVHAFKRWSGHTPLEYRRLHAAS